MKQTSIRILFQSMCLLMLAGVSSLKASSGNDTWTGAAGDNNWSDGVNWTGANTPPVAGDTLVFGQQRLSQKFFYVMGGAKAKVNPVGRTRLRTAAKANSFCHHRAS